MVEKFDPRSHIGEVHGIYTIADITDKTDKYRHRIYKCVCNECGFETEFTYSGVSAPSKLSNKCTHLRTNGEYIINRHKWENSRLGKIFRGIIVRCYNPNDKNYRWYGEKGIKVCQEWLDNPGKFEKWALNNGYEEFLTIDRIDPDVDYSPSNCRWIPLEENSRRAGKVNWIEVESEVLTGQQWAQKLGLGINTINKSVREYGVNKTKELISAMLKEPPSTKHRKSHQTWFSVYGIQV